jgi:ParB-like chromosome segregation protein Spo0J
MSAIAGLEVHEAAELFPLITGPDFDALVNDIRLNGQMEPIVLDGESRIIDGRNRARACEALNVRPVTKRYDGDNVVQFVVSHNLHRRHLTDSQRAMIAASLATRRPGYGADALRKMGSDLGDIAQIGMTTAQAGQLLAVGESSIKKAKVVRREGTPELQALVAEGHAPVTTAARVALEMTAGEQHEYVEAVRGGADPVKAAPPDLQQKPYRDKYNAKTDPRPARDEFHRGTRHIDPEQVIENTIGMLDGIASGLALVKGVTPTLDVEKRLAWLEALREPLSVINHFKKELAE